MDQLLLIGSSDKDGLDGIGTTPKFELLLANKNLLNHHLISHLGTNMCKRAHLINLIIKLLANLIAWD